MAEVKQDSRDTFIVKLDEEEIAELERYEEIWDLSTEETFAKIVEEGFGVL